VFLKISELLKRKLDHFPIPDELVNVAAHIRDAWVAQKASSLKQGSRVLDAGAGETQYRKLFSHCDYKTQDFAQYEGSSSGILKEIWNYGQLDYICDITSIPVPDCFFDAVLCTEVLEHVPKPIDTLGEFSRILAPNGRLFLSAPLSCGIHQQPFHYYGGYSPFFYKKFLKKFGFEIVEIKPIGGLMKHVGQELHRVGRILEERAPDKLSALKKYILMRWLPLYLASLDEKIFVEEFTIGYLVEAVRK